MINKPTAAWALPSTWTLAQDRQEIQEPEPREPTDTEEPELNREPTGESNPFLDPELDDLVDKKISEDVWQQLLGELPCSVTTEDCIRKLQDTAVQKSRLLSDIQARIEEAQSAVEDAKRKNLDSIAISNFSPFMQYLLENTGVSDIRDNNRMVTNPFRLILGNAAAAFLGQGLSALFNWSTYTANDSQQSRSIALGDIQIKIAELQRSKAQIADKLRERVTVEALRLEEIARAFQIAQAIAKRDKQRLEITRVSYRFGEGNSEGYLNQLSAYDRQKAATFREWSRLRNQIIKFKLLVLGTED